MTALTSLAIALALLTLLPAGSSAQPREAREFALERSVRLNGSTKNNTRYALTIPPDVTQVLPLAFRIDLPADMQDSTAEIELTPFESDGASAPGHVLREHGSGAERLPGESLTIALATGTRRVDLELNGVRPRATYTATLFLLHKGRKHEWDVALKTTDFGVLTVDKLPPLQLVTLHPFAWNVGRQFQIVLRDPANRGPFNRVRARIVDANQVKTAAINSNVTLDAFSFWAGCWDSEGCRQADLHTSNPGAGLDLRRGGELKLWARVESLSPGEYNPMLRFTADGASDRADDSKLALSVQVRHHWWVAVVVILLGSAAGLFGNKYVAGYWTARALRRETDEAAQAAAELARPDPRGSLWWCRSVANSYGLARVRVILDQAGHLSKSVFSVIAVEQEIRDRVDDARRRLDALNALQATRFRLQHAAVDRAAAQHRIKASIRRALSILDGATLRAPQRAAIDALLADVEAWLSAERQDALYREAVLGRIRELMVSVTALDVPRPAVRDRIIELSRQIEEATKLAEPTAAALLPYDHLAARLALLWRDRMRPYAEDLTLKESGGAALADLHGIADREVWQQLEKTAKADLIHVNVPSGRVKTYDLVEARLSISAGLPEAEVIDHPCVVRWKVSQGGAPPVETITYGLSLVHYFSSPGKATVSARIEWNDKHIAVESQGEVDVVQNEEYRPWASVQSVELAVTALAALFALVTGLGYGYNSSFGTSTQYIGLFLWAAGASAGGNLFKQRGSGRTVGGLETQYPKS